MSTNTAPSSEPTIDSPPAAERSHHSPLEASRQRMHRIASEFVRTQNRRLLAEYLTLRRSVR